LLLARYPLRAIQLQTRLDLYRGYVAFRRAAYDFETCAKAETAVLISGNAIVKNMISGGQFGNATNDTAE
jgi:hypothetical protein